jgi:hypothetical protein
LLAAHDTSLLTEVFPAPAFGECRHRGLARRFVAARNSKNGARAAILGKRRLLGELQFLVSVGAVGYFMDAAMHKLAVAFFYACAILSLPVMVHAVARAGMAKAEFQDPYLKALGVTLGLMPRSSQRSTPQ